MSITANKSCGKKCGLTLKFYFVVAVVLLQTGGGRGVVRQYKGTWLATADSREARGSVLFLCLSVNW